jgi:hypothetical protein
MWMLSQWQHRMKQARVLLEVLNPWEPWGSALDLPKYRVDYQIKMNYFTIDVCCFK